MSTEAVALQPWMSVKNRFAGPESSFSQVKQPEPLEDGCEFESCGETALPGRRTITTHFLVGRKI